MQNSFITNYADIQLYVKNSFIIDYNDYVVIKGYYVVMKGYY